MELQLREEQKQILSQQTYQFMNVLALNISELESFLLSAAEENPLLEVEIAQRDCFFPGNSQTAGTGNGADMDINPDTEEKTMEAYICRQLAFLHTDDKTKSALRYLAGNLDERGYLAISEADIIPRWPDGLFDSALAILQGLEPAGVGARNLSECLMLQLARCKKTDCLAYTLARDYMDRLGRGQLNRISKELGVPVESIINARDALAKLSPKPGNGFGCSGYTGYVVPDVEVSVDSSTGELLVSVPDSFLPRITLNSLYVSMLAENELSTEERVYICDKLRKAKWIVECMSRRKSTIISCAQAVVSAQEEFFRDGASRLKPLSVQSVAETLNLHRSTIYRAIQGKYIACTHGVYPLADFFAKELKRVEGEKVACQCRDAATSRISELIAHEDNRRPLSDQDIASALEAYGMQISRRTVAKYRDGLGIPAASVRRDIG